MDTRLQIRLLGPPEIRLDGQPITDVLPAKSQAVLYYLAATGKAQPRAALAALLWGDLPEDAARGNLRKALAAIREVAGPILHDEAHAVGLDPATCLPSDAIAFERLAGGARPEEAIACYGGNFLDGFYVHHAPDFEAWMLAERDRLREAYVGTLLALAESQAACEALERGIATTRRVLALEPWREEAHRLLMQLLARAGQRSAALAHYEVCRRALQEELGVEPGSETLAVVESIRRGEAGRSELTSFFKRSNLPPQPTPFVGRARELAEVVAQLRDPDCRLLALVGPGGIGKSRLALAAAQALLESPDDPRPFPDGVWFVPLIGAADLSGVLSALAAATGFRFYGEGEPAQQMLNYLREKDALLALDGFEHLTPEALGSDACLAYLSAILCAAPRVRLLVTSRAAVNLREAWSYRVAGMALPPEDPQGDGDCASDYDAVRLFCQCARRADARFSFDADRESVLRLCRLADGAPLAIELAAAWLGALPARRIADEIARGLDILTARMADTPVRHRSMRAVFEHSWGLLAEDERSVLARLAVFRGGFSLEAAETVAGASLALLAALVEKSLVQRGADGCYGLHELLRQFGAEKLAEAGETEAMRDAHSAYYLGFVRAHEGDLESAGQVAALEAIGCEIENVRAAWRWAVACGDWEAVSGALHGLYLWHNIRSRYSDGRELFRLAADRLQSDPYGATDGGSLLWRRLCAREASYLGLVGDFAVAEPMACVCITPDADPKETTLCLTTLLQIARQRGRPAEARDLALRALDLARASGDVGEEAIMLGFLCLLETNNFSRYDEARRYGDQAVRLARQTGRPNLIAWELGWLEHLAFVQGAYDESVAYSREIIDITLAIGDIFNYATTRWDSRDPRIPPDDSRRAKLIAGYETGVALLKEIGHRPCYGLHQSYLAQQLLYSGRSEEALPLAQGGLAISEEVGNRDHQSLCLLILGEVELGLGDLVQARTHLLNALRLAEAIPIRFTTLQTLYVLAALLEKEAWQSAPGVSDGAAKRILALELSAFVQADPRAAHAAKVRSGWLQEALVDELPPDVAAAAIARGRARTLEDVVAELLAPSVPARPAAAP